MANVVQVGKVGSFTIQDGVALLTIDSPPVNALGIDVRRSLREGFARLDADDAVTAIVLTCAGRTFFAGADISEFGKPFEEPDLREVCAIIENVGKRVVAAIHGTALGGGLEVALVCNHRVAVPSANFGLPEVHLGLLPGAGGTQRLTRLVGVEAALEVIGGGRPLSARKALDLGLLDALTGEESLRDDAVAFARTVVGQGESPPRARDREDRITPARGRPEIFTEYLANNARSIRGFKAPFNIVKAVEAAVEAPSFEAGMEREGELFLELLASRESAAQRHYFFAERETGKVPDVPASTPIRNVSQVGVIGAGTMGGGILMNFVDAGIPVTLVETNQATLDRGIGVVRGNYEAIVRKGRMTQEQLDRRMTLITPTLDFGALGAADLIIEAVFEQMSVKKEVFAKLDGIAKAGAVLATNTSFLDIDEIASATKRAESVVGLHFFSPANVMKLLEVIRGRATSKEVVATAMGLAKRIGKVPVLSRVCPGFIANRVMRPYMQGADDLAVAGTPPPVVDQAINDYGFAMGPFQTLDLVGLDVIGRDSNERTLAGELVRRDRLGQKGNGGFYDYDERRSASFSPIAAEVIADLARFRSIEQREPLTAEAIVARLLYPVVNEGAKVLQEGVALRASDIDVAAVLGYGWPVYTGGPMFWADGIGLDRIVAGLCDAGEEPAELLVRKATAGEPFCA